jgi:hypothetical protein
VGDPRFSIIPADAVLDRRLEPRDLQVLCIFGKHTDKRGWCRRSQVVMAKEIGCARSTVQASIDRLIAAGWLQKRPQNDLHTPGVRDSAHEYRVVLDVPDQAQDVVSPLPTDRQAVPIHASAPPADIEIGTYVNVPLSTNPSLTVPSERVSNDVLWGAYPHRPMDNRGRFDAVMAEKSDAETVRMLVAVQRFAQFHIEDAEARGVTPDAQLEYRPAQARWVSTGAWLDALTVPLKSDPVPPSAHGLVSLAPDHPDYQAVEKMLGKKLMAFGGKRTFRIEEIEQARTAA